jgi:hypothetical protein
LLKWFVFVVGGMVAYVLAGYEGVLVVMGVVTVGFIADHVRYRLALARHRKR